MEAMVTSLGEATKFNAIAVIAFPYLRWHLLQITKHWILNFKKSQRAKAR